MIEEFPRQSELETIIFPELKNKLEKLLHQDRFTEVRGDNPLLALKEDFSVCIQLALAARQLKMLAPEWEEKLALMRAEFIKQLEESQYFLTAIELNQEFNLYLLKTGNVDAAIFFADHIVDGYLEMSVQTSKSHDGTQDDFEHELALQREASIAALLPELVKMGQLRRASQLASGINQIQFGEAYFEALIQHYWQRGGRNELLQLIHEFHVRQDYVDEHASVYSQNATTFQGLAYSAIISLESLEQKSEETEKDLAAIESVAQRISAQVYLVGKLLDKDEIERAVALAEQIISELQQVDPNRTYIEDNFGTETIFVEFRIRQLTALAEILASYPNLGYLVDRCLYLENDPQMPSLVDDMEYVREEAEPDLFVRLMAAHATTFDVPVLTEIYWVAVDRNREHEEHLRTEFVKLLYAIDPSSALKEIIQTRNLALQAELFAWYVFNALYDKYPMNEWSGLVETLTDLEEKIEEMSLEPHEKQTSHLLKEIAKLALERHEASVFASILSDPRLDLDHKAEVISCAAQVLANQGPLAYSFVSLPELG